MKNGTISGTSLKELIALSVVLIVSAGPLKAQGYFTRTYTEADGIANSAVFDVVQDTSGVIWFATRSGVSSYNGSKFTNYTRKEGLNPSGYAFLSIDRSGTLWALPNRGNLIVSYFNGKEWMPFPPPDDPNTDHNFTAFTVLNSGKEKILMVGTFNSNVFIYKNGRWKQYILARPESEIKVNDFIRTDTGVIIATSRGMKLIRDTEIDTLPLLNSRLPHHNILAAKSETSADGTATGKIWILGNDWIGYCANGGFTLVSRNFHLPDIESHDRGFLYPDNKGNFYLGNAFYLYFLESKTGEMEILNRNSGLISEGATAVLIDRENNIWITGRRGVTKMPSRRFSSFTRDNGLFENEVSAGMEYLPGKYIFGHHGALSFFDGKKFRHLKLNPSREGWEHEMRIQDISLDQAGNLWIAASTLGLACLGSDGKINWYREAQGIRGRAMSVAVTAPGSIFLSTDQGLLVHRNSRFYPVPFRSYSGKSIRKLFPGKHGELFIGTIDTGLIEIRKGVEYIYKTPDNPYANNIYSFLIDSQDRKWIGSYDGLYTVSEFTLQKIRQGELTIERPVYAILEDHDHNIWFGTDNGVYRWNGKSLRHYSTKDGVSGLEINRAAAFTDHNDQIWFGTNNGLTLYRPDYDNYDSLIPPPKVRMISLETEIDTLTLNGDNILDNDNNNLAFNIEAISFIDENQLSCQYMLEGFDKEWSPEIAFQNYPIRYNNLPPGSYRFCIKVRNSIGIWSPPVRSGKIRILQPLWLRWWSITLGVLTLGLFGFLLGRFILVTRYNKRLEQMVAVRTRELTESELKLKSSIADKDRFFSIISHDLKSPFTAIQGMLELLNTSYGEYTENERRKMIRTIRSAASRTITLLENLLTWAQVQKGTLPFSPGYIDLTDIADENIRLFESVALSKSITLLRTGDDAVKVFADRDMISTVMRNLISNAIKFSFPNGTITIHVVNQQKEFSTATVTDTGKGIPETNLKRLFRIDDRISTRGTANETGTGLGLILCREFIEKNQGKLEVTSKEGEGTSFRFTLHVHAS